MSHSDFARILAPLVVLGLLASAPAGPLPADRTPTSPAAEPAGADLQVQLIDDSTMKLKILDDKLELQTKYGALRVPVSEIRRIEFATRTPPGMTQKVTAAIAKLGHADSQVRDKATSELRDFGSRAYPALVDAAKGTDAEVVRRAELLIRSIKKTVPAAELVHRDADVIHTDDSKFTGKLVAPSLRVRTFPFGEQSLRLADVRSAGPPQVVKAAEHAQPGPPNLMNYQGQFGAEMSFSVTGVNAGSLWGNDVYTLDSTLAAAAVHAGKVQVGETGVVRVRILQPPGQFGGGVRNGVASVPYGLFPSGAYEFIEK